MKVYTTLKEKYRLTLYEFDFCQLFHGTSTIFQTQTTECKSFENVVKLTQGMKHNKELSDVQILNNFNIIQLISSTRILENCL